MPAHTLPTPRTHTTVACRVRCFNVPLLPGLVNIATTLQRLVNTYTCHTITCPTVPVLIRHTGTLLPSMNLVLLPFCFDYPDF